MLSGSGSGLASPRLAVWPYASEIVPTKRAACDSESKCPEICLYAGLVVCKNERQEGKPRRRPRISDCSCSPCVLKRSKHWCKRCSGYLCSDPLAGPWLYANAPGTTSLTRTSPLGPALAAGIQLGIMHLPPM
ncbi:hypothetical protein BOTBODRAFT_493136 [Botryobasidium botryosum FD-172 SS1]|uniref:Uncharacterized protein n=1 Tax=Botryobasidium botryosum (strain FD-172 SS1) TaxID=930990 RepID=A0A067MG14_BOTB1|nr:hypothetical protein BOTBODRAFT_493136 [Botryobasidium botryosum FD-172 SS1]